MKGNARIKHIRRDFTIIPNNLLDEKNLSFRAKGVYSYLRSKPDNWNFRMQNIINASREGRDAVRAAIKELEDLGYIQRYAIQNEDTGRFSGWVWYVFDNPEDRGFVHQPENPPDG